eukprot:m.156491 g.156491  ORF g.156491 m.156491 type:complete len:76 (+) comp10218_c0_seq5:1609-1836(+)
MSFVGWHSKQAHYLQTLQHACHLLESFQQACHSLESLLLLCLLQLPCPKYLNDIFVCKGSTESPPCPSCISYHQH